MATPPFDPSNEPLGSSDPRIRDLNTRNLDRAVNANGPGKWWDRFGLEHPTLWLLGQLQAAANAIVGGGDDITQAWRNAISAPVVNRIADEPLAYTTSLADGNGTARPPLQLSGAPQENIRQSVGASGRTFIISAPGQIALRSMIPVSESSGLSEISVLTGVRPAESVFDGEQFASIAWYDNTKTRLETTESTDYYRGQLESVSRVFNFTVGPAGSGADVEAPLDAKYAIPYLGLDGTTGEIFASVLSASFVNPRLATSENLIQESTLAEKGVDLKTTFTPGTTGSAFDFTNSLLMSETPVLSERFPDSVSITSDVVVSSRSGTYEAVVRRYKGRLHPGGNPEAAGQLETSEPLVKDTAATTIGISSVVTPRSFSMLLSQTATGQSGRIQLWANGRYLGSGFANTPGLMGLFIDGAVDGSGVNGQPLPGRFNPERPVSILILLKPGVGLSEFWVNGELVDTFTKPAEIYQTRTQILNNANTGPGGDFNVLGGRLLSVDRELSDEEKEAAGRWLADAFDVPWRLPNNTSYGVLNAVGAYALVIDEGGPRNVNDFPDPVFSVNKEAPLYPASMTKVITSMVLLDNIPDTSAEIEMIEGDQTGGSGNNINPGDILTISDALYNMMLPSSNVTTTVVARTVGTLLLDGAPGDPVDRFIEEMNRKARTLGMRNSNFENASGLANSAMVSTAEDMCKLCASVLSYPDIYNRWGKPTHELNILGPNARTVTINHSIPIIDDPEVLGGKTGTVGANPGGSEWSRNLMYWIKLPNGNIAAAVVMLVGGSSSERYIDAEELIEWLKTYYRWPISDVSLIMAHPPSSVT